MRWYALIEVGDPEAIDVFLRPEEAERALEDCLRDEPEWRGLLRVEEIELWVATINGVGFFDIPHTQKPHALNFAELHPVTGIRFVSGCGA